MGPHPGMREILEFPLHIEMASRVHFVCRVTFSIILVPVTKSILEAGERYIAIDLSLHSAVNIGYSIRHGHDYY